MAWCSVAATDTRPNVLFLVVDDLRPQLKCCGESNMVTPNIDNLAMKSVLFERAYVQISGNWKTTAIEVTRPLGTRC